MNEQIIIQLLASNFFVNIVFVFNFKLLQIWRKLPDWTALQPDDSHLRTYRREMFKSYYWKFLSLTVPETILYPVIILSLNFYSINTEEN